MWVSYMCTTHTLQLEGPDHVGGQLLCVRQGHTHHSVRLRPSTGPVLKWNYHNYFRLKTEDKQTTSSSERGGLGGNIVNDTPRVPVLNSSCGIRSNHVAGWVDLRGIFLPDLSLLT